MAEAPAALTCTREFDALLGAVLGRAFVSAHHVTRNAHDAENLVHKAVLSGHQRFDQLRRHE